MSLGSTAGLGALRALSRAAALLVVLSAATQAQLIDLTVNDVGLAIGDKPQMTGLRINYRDRNLREVRGVNLTLWSPYEPPTGRVAGVAIGLPATGARSIDGIALGVLGVGVSEGMRGISIGAIGVGGGGHLKGIHIGGIGVGSGRGLTGISLAGIGVGSGGAIRGVQAALIGVGGGGDLTGISIGGIGVGAGGEVKGLSLAAIGVGSGKSVTGVSIAGVGVGAPSLNGLVLSLIAAGAKDAHAIVVAGANFKIESGGRFDGASLSAFNNIRGEQHGLTIGLLNYARELHGTQLGLINISDNNGSRRVLPVISVR
jgi:hypothetical protein